MIHLTNIYKTERAGNRENQSTLYINRNDPKFFFTIIVEKPCTFKAELVIPGRKPDYYFFDIHEGQLNREIDYAFPFEKLETGEYEAVFSISVNGSLLEKRDVKIVM